MSDTDDTDVLLLIPPNYYLVAAESQVQYLQKHQQRQVQVDFEQNCVPMSVALTNGGMTYRYKKSNHDAPTANTITSTGTTASYQFLPTDKKVELNHINSQLARLESNEAGVCGPALTTEDVFAASSDISTISTQTIRSGPHNRSPRGLAHSTPKCFTSPSAKMPPVNDNVLQEMDNYFGNNGQQVGEEHEWRRQDHHHLSNDDLCRRQHSEDGMRRLSLDLMPPPSSSATAAVIAIATPQPPNNDKELISLSDIWGRSNCQWATAIASESKTRNGPSMETTLKEEQLRRQHLEKTVHSLQANLLEYEQRLSVAIEVDRTKDTALASSQNELKLTQQEAQQCRDRLLQLERSYEELNSRVGVLDQDLQKANSVSSKLQEKNDQLEAERIANSKKCSDLQQKLDKIDATLHASRRSEDYANTELTKLRDRFAKLDYEREKLQEECTTLSQQKETLHGLQQKHRQRADALETQRTQLHETIKQYEQSEQTLKRKLEYQAKSLKAHYQQQLETVVAQKLREFQSQLDRSEEVLRSEARDREHFLAERAVKQLELMNEKSELELNLIQAKHNEEVELYRIQLANASKKIEDLEEKLNVYKTKRAAIAEQLHCVMETQWQKALAILTSPTQEQQQQQQEPNSIDELSPLETTQHNYNNNSHANAANADTPKTSRVKRFPKENNLNSNSNQRQQQDETTINTETTHADRLQAYIELLLSKSPSDFQRLDEILALSKNAKLISRNDKSNRNGNRGSATKPPWKA